MSLQSTWTLTFNFAIFIVLQLSSFHREKTCATARIFFLLVLSGILRSAETKQRPMDSSRCYALSDVGPLSSLSSLQTLDLSGCESLSDVRPLSSLHSLHRLALND